ncbi:hypothetical protein GIB67_021055 [Kingdonia uniflora]|uniref:Purple acid phosphatase n=1 Tax=Kingdonia uniflora TaxID=39325 RepID=A0A7J7N6Z8_9MAGN|nr:hypothetical protein GIB67_021055 [Kingdonia uniflora]
MELLMKVVVLMVILVMMTITVSVGSDYVRPKPRKDLEFPWRRSKHSSYPQQVHISLAGEKYMRVIWITGDESSPSLVEYGTIPGVYTSTAIGESTSYSYFLYSSGKIHHTVIGPLKDDALYYYRCGGQGPEFNLKTPPSQLPITFAVAGDLGQTGWTASTLDHIEQCKYDVHLLPGDLAYADYLQHRWDTFGELVQPLASTRPWMVTEGNHEKENIPFFKDGFASYNSRWKMPFEESGSSSNLYYSFEVAGVHVVMLGSYTDHDEISDQFSWLKGISWLPKTGLTSVAREPSELTSERSGIFIFYFLFSIRDGKEREEASIGRTNHEFREQVGCHDGFVGESSVDEERSDVEQKDLGNATTGRGRGIPLGGFMWDAQKSGVNPLNPTPLRVVGRGTNKSFLCVRETNYDSDDENEGRGFCNPFVKLSIDVKSVDKFADSQDKEGFKQRRVRNQNSIPFGRGNCTGEVVDRPKFFWGVTNVMSVPFDERDRLELSTTRNSEITIQTRNPTNGLVETTVGVGEEARGRKGNKSRASYTFWRTKKWHGAWHWKHRAWYSITKPQGLRQKLKTVDEFTNEFYLLSSRVTTFETEAQKVSRFKIGLSKKIQDKLTMVNVYSITEALEMAKRAETKLKPAAYSSFTSPVTTSTTSTIMTLKTTGTTSLAICYNCGKTQDI